MNEANLLIETPTKAKAKKSKEMEIKAQNFWDSVQTLSVNKVMQEIKYRAELAQLRRDVGMDVVSDYIFGVSNENIENYLLKRDEIDARYAGKKMDSCIDDQGNYVYSDHELEQIEFMKSNSL
jgi:hypothetical protein